MGLNTAPLGQVFLPNQAQPIQYDFNKLCVALESGHCPNVDRTDHLNHAFSGLQAEPFSSFLAQHTGLPITFSRPADYGRIGSVVTILIGFVTGCVYFWRYVKVFVLSRWLWAFASLVGLSIGFQRI
jgi:hypothetical protein